MIWPARSADAWRSYVSSVTPPSVVDRSSLPLSLDARGTLLSICRCRNTTDPKRNSTQCDRPEAAIGQRLFGAGGFRPTRHLRAPRDEAIYFRRAGVGRLIMLSLLAAAGLLGSTGVTLPAAVLRCLLIQCLGCG